MEETRKYKQTELGLLPEDWEVVLLSDLARNFIGLTYSPDNVKEYGTLVLRSSNIQNGKICYDNNVFVDMDIPERAKVRQNDILVCVRNGSTSLIGKCAIIGELKSDTAFGAFMTILRSKDGISPNFLFYIWQSEILQQQIKNNLGATINQITNKDIDSFVVAIPPTIKEQRRIASALTSIDNLIDSLDRLIAKKRDIKQGVMQQLLSGKKRLKGFTEPWKIYKIDDLFDIGNGYTPSKANSAYWTNGTIPWFRMEDIRANGRILKDSIQHITEEAVKNSGLFPANSIILSTTATIGEHALLIADSLANQQFSFLIRKLNRCSDIDIMFFFYYCFILGEWCRANINDGGLMAVNMTDLKNYTFSAPSLPEQQAIASVLTSMDNELSALEAKRKKYEQIKQGMMQQLLTGKIRLAQ